MGTTTGQQHSGTTPYIYPRPFDYWAYTSQYNNQANHTQYPYPYTGYYQMQMAGMPQQYNPYTCTQSYGHSQSRNGQLNWQQPYQAPSVVQEGVSTAQGTGTMHRFRLEPSQTPSGVTTPAQTSTHDLPSTSSGQSTLEATPKSPNIEKCSAAEPGTSGGPPEQVAVHKDLSVLSSLQPSQIAEILCNNPEIQGIVWAAVDKAMAQARDES